MRKRKTKYVLGTVVVIGLGSLISAFTLNLANNEKIESMTSVNYSNGKYQNLEETPTMNPNSSMLKVMKDYMKKVDDQTPDSPVKTLPFNANEFVIQQEGIHAVWFGHSTVLFKIGEKTMLTDPFFGERASPVSFGGTKKFDFTNDTKVEDLPEVDVVLISHDHYDHLDKGSIKQLYQKVGVFAVPLGVGKYLIKWGVPKTKVVEMDWWQSKSLNGVDVTMTPARHFSGRSLKRNTTLWGSYVVQVGDQKVFFSGDSGYGKHFKEIGDKFGPFDLTLMECGQYNESWSLIHMNPKETYQANVDLGGQKMIPLHWGKFKLSLHPWTEPVEVLLQSSNGDSANILTPQIGEFVSISNTDDLTYWWR